MKLETLVHDLALKVCDPVLCHRCGGSIEFALHHLLNAAIDKGSANLYFRLHFGEFVLCRLKIHDCLAEHFALAYIINSPLQGGLGGGDPRDSDLQALPRQLFHKEDEALAIGPEARIF